MIDAYRVQLIASAVDKLTTNYPIIDLDHRVIAYAATHTASQLKSWVNRFVAKAEPDRAAERARAEVGKRGVHVDHQDDGMSYLTSYLPTSDAVMIDRLLTTRAKNTASGGRTMDQMRADELVDLLLSDGKGGPTSRRAVIGITVPVTTLTGLTNDPGTAFDGSFALPADLVRDLAAEPGTLFYRVMTDPLGTILDVTELGRRPSDDLRIAVEIRDGTCQFATCTRPAEESDLDHEEPWPRGPTNGANLAALCRRHHEMKTHHVANPRTATIHPRTPSTMERHLRSIIIEYDGAA